MWLSYFEQYFRQVLPQFLWDKPWNYKDDLCMVGAFDLYEASGDRRWLLPILDSASFLMDKQGRVTNWTLGEHNLDKVSFGKSLRILGNLTGQTRYAEAVKKAYGMLSRYPRTETGNFWHKDIYPDQVWLDGLYMAMPFYAACLAETGEDRWDDILNQFRSAHALLWEPEAGLYHHACDCSRKAEWADRVSGKSPAVWLRAEGWYLMALADTYEIARVHTPRAQELCVLLEDALDGLRPYQDSKTKLFYQVPNMADHPDNYPETSGSAMAAYAMMKGARLSMIPHTWWEKGSRVLDGIRDTCLRKEGETYTLHGICASAGLGPGPDNRTDRTGTPEYYFSEKQMADNQHGAAACMMAVSEQLRKI